MASRTPKEKHVIVVGAGPGGLTAAMILAHRGFKVTVFEKEEQVGGRNGEIEVNGYRFDIGPTFLIMKFLLDAMFQEAGRKSEDYMTFERLEPMYELRFDETSFSPTTDPEKMKEEIERVFPGESGGLDVFLEREGKKFRLMQPCLQKPYLSPSSLVSRELLRALPHLTLTKSLYGVLSGYFRPEFLRLSFTFQSKYLGMSPWSCPGAFSIIPYLEYGYGIYHVMGGLCEISRGLARAAKEDGAGIQLGTPVSRLVVKDRSVQGVELEDGTKIEADDVLINADFGHAMSHLVEPGILRKYSEEKLKRREFSCSTFMLYLGVDKVYDMTHHTIVFARDYKRNLEEITGTKILSKDASFYVRNATVTDPALAPEGHSAIYILVPVPNNSGRVDWQKEGPGFRDLVLDTVTSRTSMKDLRDHIRAEVIIQPPDWENERGVFLGATFNLAHSLSQMLYFRPRNRFEELGHCYLAGGGTHPGSGLPTIFESGRISANLICQDHGVPCPLPVPLESP